MIEVTHICKSYQGIRALDDVSFSIKTGSICGLLGPNGAGKSTTMNIMCGCLSATSGEVRYDGMEIYADMHEAKREIGYLPEIPPLYPELTPREYLTFVARIKGLGREEAASAVDELTERCGLAHVLDRIIANLSRGHKQRVGIAEALIGNPRFVVLDEPTVGLDPIQIVEIRELIRGLAPDHTVLVSSHILSEIRSICDQIVMISHGRVVADDTPEHLEQRAGTTSVLTVVTETTTDELTSALEGIDGIQSLNVTPGDEKGTACAVIETPHDADIRALVARTLMDKGILVVGMTRSSASLEDAFIELAREGASEDASEALESTGVLPRLDAEGDPASDREEGERHARDL